MASYSRLVAAAAVWLIALGPAISLQAEETCSVAPTGAAPEGQHWYYRTDPIKQIKCWHLGAQARTAPATQQNQLGPTAILPNRVPPNRVPPNRSPAAGSSGEGAQVEQASQRTAAPAAPQPHVSQRKRTEASPRQAADVPLPKPAPYPKELNIQRVGTSETAQVQASGAQPATATKIEGTQFSGRNTIAGANSQGEAAPALLPWPDPPQKIDNSAVASPAPALGGQVRQAEPLPNGAQTSDPLQSSDTSPNHSSNTEAALQETGISKDSPLAQAIAQDVGSPESAVILDAAKPAGPETILLELTSRISALAPSSNSYSETIAAIVLSTLAFALILAVAFVHRVGNRILILIAAGTDAPQRENYRRQRRAFTRA
jgi:hypothetical protein